MTLSNLTVHHVRLGSGLILLTYVSMHMLNHMLALRSIGLAERALYWAIQLWQSWPGTLLLYGGFAVHLALALYTIFERRHWGLPYSEWFRLWAGFSLPLLLIGHVVGTRVATSFYGFQPDYEKVVAGLINSGAQGSQIALLAPGWIHGCMGLWIGFRHRPAMVRAKPVLIAAMIAIPALSAAGYLRMSWALEAHTDIIERHALSLRPHAGSLREWQQGLMVSYMFLILAAFLAGRLRRAEDAASH